MYIYTHMCVCVCLFVCLFVCICKANTYDDNPYNMDAFFSHEKNPLRKSQLEASKQQQQVLFGVPGAVVVPPTQLWALTINGTINGYENTLK